MVAIQTPCAQTDGVEADPIYCAYPLGTYQKYEKAIEKAIKDVCASGTYVLGQQVLAFEKRWPLIIGCGMLWVWPVVRMP